MMICDQISTKNIQDVKFLADPPHGMWKFHFNVMCPSLENGLENEAFNLNNPQFTW